MTKKMQKFVSVSQAFPDKRDAKSRRADFGEVYKAYAMEKAAEQAARCSQCGIPFCQIHCPLQNNIPDWLKLAAEGRLEEGYLLASETNNMPEICGRICPQDVLCEGNCVIEKGFSSVTIGSIEKFLTDNAWDEGWVRALKPGDERGQSVAIIGAGPAGLAAAEQLRIKGYGVDIYDRYDRAGGMLIYGIPNFKLEKHIVARRVDRLADAGIGFHLNTEIGPGLPFAELRERYDAILIATGTYKARNLTIPGADQGGLLRAMDYLTAANRVSLGDSVQAYSVGTLNANGKTVAVIGGGDTAMDCVRTAIRQGARSVKCLYRRDRANMPGSPREVINAEEEGVEFVWLSSPKAIKGKGRTRHIRIERMSLGSADRQGRRRPQPVSGSEFTIRADMIIGALGFEAEELPAVFGANDLAVGNDGVIETKADTLMTSIEGVFAAGDIARGPSLVVWAIRDGRLAGESIHQYLMDKTKLTVTSDPGAFYRDFEFEPAL